ncbi:MULTISPECIES: hypothetical protein [unclassified Listeria]|uniref:hypothetical protein n=1 Tax=unclassified Listeria TaxID=2642072 RepID=UPI000B593546|nr:MULTISPECIES: hypothetical protein [unclassified Listeria]
MRLFRKKCSSTEDNKNKRVTFITSPELDTEQFDMESSSQTFEHALPQQNWLLKIAGFTGIYFDFSFIFIKLLFRRTFTSTNEIEKFLHIHVLGVVKLIQISDEIPMKLRKGAR